MKKIKKNWLLQPKLQGESNIRDLTNGTYGFVGILNFFVKVVIVIIIIIRLRKDAKLRIQDFAGAGYNIQLKIQN